MRLLTWNIFRGDIQGKTINGQPAVTPLQRLNIIMGIATANNVDVVLIQELPAGGNFPPGFVAPINWGQASISENAAGVGPTCSNFNTTYGFLWNTLTVNAPGGIYRMVPTFQQLTGCYMRTPVGMDMQSGGVNYTIYNWHNEAPPVDADRGLQLLSQQIYGPDTVVAGDFNRTAQQVDVYFGNAWTDIVGVGPNGEAGIDHILSNSNNVVGPVLENVLDFTSDARHWPIAADL